MRKVPSGRLRTVRRRGSRTRLAGIGSGNLRLRLRMMQRPYGAQESDCISPPAATFRRSESGSPAGFEPGAADAGARAGELRSTVLGESCSEARQGFSCSPTLGFGLGPVPGSGARRSTGTRRERGSGRLVEECRRRRRQCNPINARHRRAQPSGAAPAGRATQFRNKMTGSPPPEHP